jgi:AraC-like DNA-binding protein
MNFSLKKIFGLRSQLIRAVTAFLIILAAINVLVYNAFEELSSIRQMKELAGMVSSQIGISYETILSYMVNTVNKIAIFDSDRADYDLETVPWSFYEFQTSINKDLSSIVSMNSYIHSAYIYIGELDKVFDSRSGFPRTASLETFADNGIFREERSNYLRFAGPRILLDNSQWSVMNTVITLISPLSVRNSANTYLAVNINADTLYNAVFKNINLAGGLTFYAYNADRVVIMHNSDTSRLYTVLAQEDLPAQGSDLFYFFNRRKPITATYTSSFLNWAFTLEVPVQPVIHNLFDYVAINLVIVFIILGLLSFFIILKTGQVHTAALAMSDTFWKEALLDRVYIDDEMIQQLNGAGFSTDGGGLYNVISVSLSAGGDEYAVSTLLKTVFEKLGAALAGEDCEFRRVPVSKSSIAVVVRYTAADTSTALHRRVVEKLYACLSPEEQRLTFIALSGLQNKFALLPLCWRQCEDALNYKIYLDSPILDHSLIRESDTAYEFPVELARQLSNNIAAGDKAACADYLDKIFAPLENRQTALRDEQIVNLVISLQNSAFKTISALRVPLKPDAAPDFSAEKVGNMKLGDMKAALRSFIEKICDEVHALKENQERGLSRSVIEYLEKNCLRDHLISLVSVADELRLGKNQVSGIVREASGMSFTEFINKKRIEYAKALLRDNSMTIEGIAKSAGFNYSYYFIKVFKALEGVTPGQYRSARIDSAPAGA